MNYKELFEKFDHSIRVIDFFARTYNHEVLIQSAQTVIDCDNELEKLGDDLDFSDFENVKEIIYKREQSMEMFLHMSRLGNRIDRKSTPKERLEWEREKEKILNEAINGKIDF